jgi:hypothetical protein
MLARVWRSCSSYMLPTEIQDDTAPLGNSLEVFENVEHIFTK